MTAIGLTIFLVLLLGFSLALALRGQTCAISSVSQLNQLSRPVDLAAFRNLTSAADEQYLRSSLSGRQFRRVQRSRMRAALEYVGRTAHNSALLLRLGESGRRSDNPQLAKAAAELAESALHMRLLCLAAMASIMVRILFPQLRLSPGSICDRYAATREHVVALGRIELPAVAGRLESSL